MASQLGENADRKGKDFSLVYWEVRHIVALISYAQRLRQTVAYASIGKI